MATVRDYMDANPVTVTPEATVEDVARTLGEHDLHGVPVVGPDGAVVGMVTESDLVITDEQGDLHVPHYVELFGGLIPIPPFRDVEARLKKAVAATAAEMMTADPATVGPDDDVHEAAHVIVETGHNRIPVVEGGRLVGVISRADVVRALAADR